jgi:hypothetical protein
MSVSAAEVAHRTRASLHVRINEHQAAMFLGYWLEHHIVEEVLPGRYRLTPKGEHVASGLLTTDLCPQSDRGCGLCTFAGIFGVTEPTNPRSEKISPRGIGG